MNDRIVRRAYRARSWLLCHVGRHMWARRRIPRSAGGERLFDECRRCGTVRMGWDERGPGPIG